MLDTELNKQLRGLGMPPAQAAQFTRQIRDYYHPVAAVAHAKLAAAVAAAPVPIAGLAGTVSVKGAAAGASAGATVGSVIPGVGTAIGAVVGAVAGIIAGFNAGQKPERYAAAVANFKALLSIPSTYAGRLMTAQNFNDLNRALFILGHNGGPSDPAAHPSAMDGWWIIANQILHFLVQQGAANQVGATVSVTIPAYHAPNGGWPAAAFTFVNPGLADSAAFSQQVVIPGIDTVLHKVEGSGYDKYWADPYLVKFMDLATDYAIYAVAPQNFSTTVAQAPAAAATTGTAAATVNVPASTATAATAVAQGLASSGNTTPTLSKRRRSLRPSR